MTCKCKLPIIRGYEPDLYCLNCGLKLKNKTMRKKIKSVKLAKDYRTSNFEFVSGTELKIKNQGCLNESWVIDCFKSFSTLDVTQNKTGLFDIEYEPEPERKKICVVIELNEIDGYPKVKFKEVETALKSHFCHTDRNIKVTEIKPPEISKEDVKWIVATSLLLPIENLWRQFQAKKEAENG